MRQRFPLDLAVRASNLMERSAVVAALSDTDGADVDLTEWDERRIDGVVTHFDRRRGAADPGDLRGVLGSYRRWELAGDVSAAQADHLKRLHDPWLPTYERAMSRFDEADLRLGRRLSPWLAEEVYYGRLACACAPFLAYVEAVLSDELAGANMEMASSMFDEALVDDLVGHLLGRVQLMVTWAVEVEKNMYCTREGVSPEHAPPQAYTQFLDQTFADGDCYHRFYLRFPVLGRWLAQLSAFVIDIGRNLLGRLGLDLAEIGRTLFGVDISAVRSVQLGKSDFHAGGQSVGLVRATLVGGAPAAFIYKPRGVEAEWATQRLLETMTAAGAGAFATYIVIRRPGYGYAQLIPAARNRVERRPEAAAIYQQLGGHLALFHAFGGGDLHFENVLIADGHLMVCDCETILGARPHGPQPAEGTLLDSVYRTGLLEWPRLQLPAVGEMQFSGVAGGLAYRLPMRVPRVKDDRRSFAMGVVHRDDIEVDPGSPNRVFLGDQLALPADFKDEVAAGFGRVHDWLAEHKPAAVTGWFEASDVRFVNLATQAYAQLLLGVAHPKCLMDPLQVDVVFDQLAEHRPKWDPEGCLTASEQQALWQLDIPLFTVPANETQLRSDYRQHVPFTLAASPLDDACQRLSRLTAGNRSRQLRYIAASLSAEEVHSPDFVATAVEYARRMGAKLCDLVRGEFDLAPWYDLEMLGGGELREIDILSDLYNGTAGIAFFLAYLDFIAPDERARATARRALEHALANCRPDRIGAFEGTAGIVYVLVHLAQLWGEDALLDQAVQLSRRLAGGVAADSHFDILSGVAGTIPVMLALSQYTGGEGLDCAHACARHLLDNLERSNAGVSWPAFSPEEVAANLTGFAHGPAGIGWALILLGTATGRGDYIDTALEGFRYEASKFDDVHLDWYDLRTSIIAMAGGGRHFSNAWCNGSAGIGLSRIASWALLGGTDDQLLREAHLALAATLRNATSVKSETLCHGRSGNAELYLRFALLRDVPAFQMEANLSAQSQWNTLDADATLERDTRGRAFPGLMLGFAGFGLHFLRLAAPAAVPSPLLLDPPPAPYSGEDRPSVR